jgi:hypothetical protein
MKNKNILWIVGIIIFVFVVICVIVFSKINKNIVPEKNLTYALDTSCNVDSDCIIKTNGLNCPKAFNKIEVNSEYKQMMPPGYTACPNANEVVAFCSQSNCSIKYECSKCDVLKKELGKSCSLPNEDLGQIRWICEMYSNCNCS